jgi:hypothetical protein
MEKKENNWGKLIHTYTGRSRFAHFFQSNTAAMCRRSAGLTIHPRFAANKWRLAMRMANKKPLTSMKSNRLRVKKLIDKLRTAAVFGRQTWTYSQNYCDQSEKALFWYKMTFLR